MKIVFAGTPYTAHSILEYLANICNIILVITKPDKYNFKKQIPNLVKEFAMANNIPYLQPDNVADIQEKLTAINPDMFIVVAYGKIIPASVLKISNYGWINVHFSLLPRWRGAAPIQRAIMNGDRKTGVTIMKMNEKLDEGDIILQKEIVIDSNQNASVVTNKLLSISKDLLQQFLLSYDKLLQQSIKQNNEDANYAHKVQKSEGRINWHKNAITINRIIHALNPKPMCFTMFNDKIIKILDSKVTINDIPVCKECGTVFFRNKKMIVYCGGNSMLEILELQLSGKRIQLAKDFINGYKSFSNNIIFV